MFQAEYDIEVIHKLSTSLAELVEIQADIESITVMSQNRKALVAKAEELREDILEAIDQCKNGGVLDRVEAVVNETITN